MSYSFDGTNDRMTGQFDNTYDTPLTLAIWFKFTDHPIIIDTMLQFGADSASNTNSYNLRTTINDNGFAAMSVDSGGGFNNAEVAKTGIDSVWTPFVGIFPDDLSRTGYVSDQSGVGGGDSAGINAVQYIKLGESLAGANDYTGLLAEAAVWNTELSAGQIANFLAGVSPSDIAPANLIGYWPLRSSSGTQVNQGVGSGGNLSVTGATFSSDHPFGTGRRRRTALMGLG